MNELFARVIVAVSLCSAGAACGYSFSYVRANKVCNDEKLALAQEINTTKEAQSIGVDNVITRYVNITHEVPIYVPSENNSCNLFDGNFRMFHDRSAGHSLPEAARNSDAATASLDTVATTIGINYNICAKNADQLEALQEWARVVSK